MIEEDIFQALAVLREMDNSTQVMREAIEETHGQLALILSSKISEKLQGLAHRAYDEVEVKEIMQLTICLAEIDLIPRDTKVAAHNVQYLIEENKMVISQLCLDQAFTTISEALQMKCVNANHKFEY